MRTVRDLRAFQEALALVRLVYAATARFPIEELRAGLGRQMRRAAASITANIAEGQGRPSARERLRFLSIAWGSLVEVEAHADVAEVCGLLDPRRADAVRLGAKRTGRLLTGLRRVVSESAEPRTPPNARRTHVDRKGAPS